ncbi:hypothetical protein D3C80_1799750 [compost metagenome]
MVHASGNRHIGKGQQPVFLKNHFAFHEVLPLGADMAIPDHLERAADLIII